MNSTSLNFSALFGAFIGMLAGIVRLVMLPVGLLIRRIPWIQKTAARIAKDDSAIAQLEQESLFLAHSNAVAKMPAWRLHLLRGERREAAERLAAPADHRHLYMDVPEDLRRSIVEDGRICNGTAPAVALAGSTITPQFIENAWRSSTQAAVNLAFTVLVGWSALTLGAAWTQAHFSAPASADPVNTEVGEIGRSEMARVAAIYKDVWQEADARGVLQDLKDAEASVARAARAGDSVQRGLTALVFIVLSLAAGVIAAGAAARVYWIGRLRYLVFAAANAGVEGLRHNWREALQRWRWRLPERDMLLSAYADQVQFATKIDRSPLIELGTASGLLEHRGHLLAPMKGTPVRMSILDMLQHVEVLGGSGEGKSRNFYIPVVRQLIQLRKQGYPISIYATDDKGAIGDDIVAEVKAAGVSEDEVLRIGTGPNDWRIDLCAGLGPVELAEIIRSVSAQMGGSSSDDFWPEMASDLIAQVGIVLQAVELTEAGKAWAVANNMRVHSILNLLRVAGDDTLIAESLQMIAEAAKVKEELQVLKTALNMSQLRAATGYLSGSYLPLAAATKDGIRANMRKALKAFAAKPELSVGFADGKGAKLLPPSALLEPKLKVINISQIEHGSAGRIVSIMLKTLLFKQARMAELKNPAFAKERLQWWFNPQLGPDVEKYALTFFLADEYQALATSSNSDGLSDASVWNVLRSAGIGGIVLSQSVSAFRLAVGDAATENMRRNWRTKIILRTEDLDTIDEAKKLAGKTMRFHSMDWNQLESAAAARRETGVSADALRPAVWSDEIAQEDGHGHFRPFHFPDFNQPYSVDERFIPEAQNGSEALAALAAEQAAHWRSEDRNAGALQHGINDAEAVRDEDIMEMGRGRALVYIQRAGGTRVDVIKLH